MRKGGWQKSVIFDWGIAVCRYITIPPSRLRRATSLCTREALGRGVEHIFDEDAVARCGIVYKNMGDCADQFAVLNDGAAAHADVKCGTKIFCVFLQILCVLQVKGRFLHTSTRIHKLT